MTFNPAEKFPPDNYKESPEWQQALIDAGGNEIWAWEHYKVMMLIKDK